MMFPPQGLVYDYRLEDGGVSKPEEEDEEGEDKAKAVSTKSIFITLEYIVFMQVIHWSWFVLQVEPEPLGEVQQ